jgi:pimeloyl-ACP methyl ester carboxylesterase
MGYNRVGAVLRQDSEEVERRFVPVSGRLDAGQKVRMDSWAFEGDPQTGLGIPYKEITYASPLGMFPAWLVEGNSRTWAIFVHGKGAARGQSLRVLRTLADLSMPTLVITYRNDDGAPLSPDGFYRYGATEWEDLEGAVRYALDNGAEDVLLIGYSMGGAIVMGFLERSPLASEIIGVVLDAPMLSFGETVDFSGREEGHPRLAVVIGRAVSRYRFDMDWGAVDYLRRADELVVPVLLIHGDADRRVPIETSREFARARPDLVTYVEFANAPHVAAWNVDAERYEQTLRAFLAGLVR